MTTINSITKKDGEVLTVGDTTNKGKIKFFRDFMGQIWVAFHETPQQFKVDDVSKKGVGDGFVWTDELVEKYKNTYYHWENGMLSAIESFKESQSTPPKEEQSYTQSFEGLRVSDKPITFTKRPEEPKEEKRDWEIVEFWYDGNDVNVVELRHDKGGVYCYKSPIGSVSGSLEAHLKEPHWHIHSVRRLSDGEVFSVGDEIGYDGEWFTIEGFSDDIKENGLRVLLKEGGFFFLHQIKKPQPQENKERIEVTIDENAFKDRCGVCGNRLVEIRGKYPSDEKRKVCATCNTERLEQINEISSKGYGQAYQSKP